MGFEFWLNGVKYDYASLKTVFISVDKHDLEHGDMFEHTVIKIETRRVEPVHEFEEVKESDLPELEEIKDEPSGIETGENSALGEPTTPDMENPGAFKHLPSNTPEGWSPCNACDQPPTVCDICELSNLRNRKPSGDGKGGGRTPQPSGDAQPARNTGCDDPAPETPEGVEEWGLRNILNKPSVASSECKSPERIRNEYFTPDIQTSEISTEPPKSKNLQEGVVDEMRRNRKLLEVYKGLGPVGEFGASVVENAITIGEEALKTGDAVEMIRAYNTLKETK